MVKYDQSTRFQRSCWQPLPQTWALGWARATERFGHTGHKTADQPSRFMLRHLSYVVAALQECKPWNSPLFIRSDLMVQGATEGTPEKCWILVARSHRCRAAHSFHQSYYIKALFVYIILYAGWSLLTRPSVSYITLSFQKSLWLISAYIVFLYGKQSLLS